MEKYIIEAREDCSTYYDRTWIVEAISEEYATLAVYQQDKSLQLISSTEFLNNRTSNYEINTVEEYTEEEE